MQEEESKETFHKLVNISLMFVNVRILIIACFICTDCYESIYTLRASIYLETSFWYWKGTCGDVIAALRDSDAQHCV